MLANRFVVLIDACALFGALQRNTLLSLAEAGLYRVKWSHKILSETEAALAKRFQACDVPQPNDLAAKQRLAMERAFEEAMVTDYECHESSITNLPDANDIHVVAAAISCDASLIITDNLKDFPASV